MTIELGNTGDLTGSKAITWKRVAKSGPLILQASIMWETAHTF